MKGATSKARLLKNWGGYYAGQIVTNVEEGSIPADAAVFYEEGDPAVETVVEHASPQGGLLDVEEGELDPEKVALHDEAARKKGEASEKALQIQRVRNAELTAEEEGAKEVRDEDAARRGAEELEDLDKARDRGRQKERERIAGRARRPRVEHHSEPGR